jgi:hypothetical protein
MKYFFSFINKGKSIGKSRLALFMSLLFIACTPYNNVRDDDIYLPDKSEFISFEIEFAENQYPEILNTQINLIIKNISANPIVIDEPNCLPVNIMPVLQDSNGVQLQMLFRARPYCDPDPKILDKGDEYKTIFKYGIEECFRLNSQNRYELKFVYKGNIYNLRSEKLTNRLAIWSNTLQLIT